MFKKTLLLIFIWSVFKRTNTPSIPHSFHKVAFVPTVDTKATDGWYKEYQPLVFVIPKHGTSNTKGWYKIGTCIAMDINPLRCFNQIRIINIPISDYSSAALITNALTTPSHAFAQPTPCTLSVTLPSVVGCTFLTEITNRLKSTLSH